MMMMMMMMMMIINNNNNNNNNNKELQIMIIKEMLTIQVIVIPIKDNNLFFRSWKFL